MDWQEVKRVFHEALDLPASDRAAWIDRTCEGRDRVRREVLELLADREHAAEFLEPVTAVRPPAPENVRLEGATLAGRYLLHDRLGRGGAGTVYGATDLLRGASVAVKVLPGAAASAMAAVRREVAMLRLLRLPGVVQLLDDGIEGEYGFLVMERVSGVPFPGTGRAGEWGRIETTVLALLETLARIHWAGVLHCDLKPANVLVDADGVPTVLDLGVSAWQEADSRWRESGYLFGTLGYLAPERMQGQRPTAPGDLFSLGVMVYEALAGRAPYERQRESSDPFVVPFVAAPPLQSVAPDVPAKVAALVDRLVAPDPVRRPQTAAEAHALLGGQGERRRLPRFCDHEALETVLEAAHANRSIDVAAPNGGGRTRMLHDVERALTAAGRRCVRLAPSDEPFGSLGSELEEVAADATLDEIAAYARMRVQSLLQDGIAVFADDADGLDRWTSAVLDASRGAGTVVRAFGPATAADVRLEGAPEEHLRELVHGPDRIHHLREDAAVELWRRTRGRPAAVIAELDAWVRAGLARWEQGRVHIGRRDLERLRAGLRTVPGESFAANVPAELADLLACIDLAGDAATFDLIAKTLERPRWVLEAQLHELERCGSLRRDGTSLVPLVPPPVAGGLPPDARRRTHRAIAAALPEATEGRLYHLLAAHELEAVIAETPATASALLRAGKVDRALSILDDGLGALRRVRSEASESAFLRLMLEAALAAATTSSLDLLLYHLVRSEAEFDTKARVEAIARGALHAIQGDPRRALEILDGLEMLGEPQVDRCLWAVRAVAASYLPVEEHAHVVDDAVAWAANRSEPDIQAAGAEWLGWLRYRQQRFLEAAELHSSCAALADGVSKRIAGLLNAAWAALEAFDLDEASSIAARARESAAGVRHAHFELRAEALLRCAAYRRGETDGHDPTLIEAGRMLGASQVHGVLCLNEAAAAWRARETEAAKDLAREATDALHRAGHHAGALLAGALAELCARGARDELDRRCVEASRCPLPGIAVQALALLHRAHGLPQSWRDRAAARAGEIPEAMRDKRREVLAVTEALAWLEGKKGNDG